MSYRITFNWIFLVLCICCSSYSIAQNGALELNEYQIQLRINDAIERKDFSYLAMNYSLLGDFKISKENQVEAFKAYTKSINYYGAVDDSTNYYQVSLKLADYYVNANLANDAFNLHLQAINFFNREKLEKHLAPVYAGLAHLYKNKGKLEEQNIYINKAISSNKIVKDTILDIALHIEKAELYETLEYYNQALEASKHSLNLSQIIGDSTSVGLNLMRIGIIENYNGNYLEAEDFLYRSERLLEASLRPQLLLNLYQQSSDNYMSMEDYPLAYDYLNKYTELNDSLINATRTETLSRLTLEFQNEQKEAEIEELQKEKINAKIQTQRQRNLIYSFIFAGLVTLIGIYFIIRFYQQQIAAKEIITRQTAEINQQKIVDLENNLKIETMHSMLEGQEAERQRVAKDLHDSLGGLLSTVKLNFESLLAKSTDLENANEFQKANILLDEACQEVRNISNNMQPGALNKLGLVPAINDLINRFQADHYPEIFFQQYGLNKKLDSSTNLMVYRLIQELLINSIKHAEANEVIIQLTEEDDQLSVLVEDDGKGYDVENVKKGMGTGNIASRVNYLKGDLSLHSMKDQGTSTLITIPI